MGRIVSVHSYRGGTGKSNITANLAYLFARSGQRVAVLDTDLQSPGVHVVLGIKQERITFTLADFLFGKCELEESAYDVSLELRLENSAGKLYLLPSSMAVDDISRVLAQGYDVNVFIREFKKLTDQLKLDVLFLDTHPGLNRETMLTTAISDCLLVLIRPDEQDYHGTAVLLEVAQRLRVPQLFLLVNKVVGNLSGERLCTSIQEAFGSPVIGALPLDQTMASLGSRGVFALHYPDHPLSVDLKLVADYLGERCGTFFGSSS